MNNFYKHTYVLVHIFKEALIDNVTAIESTTKLLFFNKNYVYQVVELNKFC